MRFIRDIPDGGHYDMIVCGAGPGGVAAAVTAARLNKKVLLLDNAGCLGGYWTSGLMGISLDMPGKGGLPQEILNELLKKNMAQWVDTSSYTYDIEAMKYLLEKMALDAGVNVRLYTRVTAVKMENNRISAILADGMTSQAFTADYFVDGTGHGTLAALAGCGYETGDTLTGQKQPASLESLVVGVPEDLWHSDIHNRTVKQKLKSMLMQLGVDCSYPHPLLFRLSPGGMTYKLAINHQYHVCAEDDQSVTDATLSAREEINHAVVALRSQPGWENLTLVQTAEQIGLRDGRRIHGLNRVTVTDALAGRFFSDGISPVHFCIDVHKLSPDYIPPDSYKGLRIQPFSIPFGSLVSADVSNLFLTGRCIDGDFLAHSAYRTTCTACATGEAVGIAMATLLPGASAHDADGVYVHGEMVKKGYALED